MPAAMHIIEGLGVSTGIAIGRAVCLESRAREVFRFPLPEDRLDDEVLRLQQAVARAEKELEEVRGGVGGTFEEELGGILDAHLLLLRDRTFLGRVEERIREEHVNAEWALHKVTHDLLAKFEAIDNEYLRERRQDLLDVGHYLLRCLQGISNHELSEIEGDVVLVADDLPTSEAVRLGRERVVGFAVETGSRTSHTTIIARSLNVPLVTGLEGVTSLVTDEDPVIVDGEHGRLILHPTPAALEAYRRRQRELVEIEEGLQATRELEARTADGVRVHLMANIDLPEEIADGQRFGSDGIGLYRSEFLYIERSPELPSEEEHAELYQRLAEAAAPEPAIIRTYDLGGRKLARELMATQEENPVLGLRGIRLTMARPAIFRTQLRGLYRAAVHGDIWIMLPMITTLDEVRAFKEFAAQVGRELAEEGIPHRLDLPVGVMIEVPAAAMIAELLAEEVDFFSIGTNDLIQYALAVDRNNEHVASLYQPLHPAVLRMLRFVVSSAREAGIEVSLCGEMGSDPAFTPLLLGLGLRRLSMSARMIPAVKTRLRGLSVDELEELAQRCCRVRTADEVQQILDTFLVQAVAQ